MTSKNDGHQACSNKTHKKNVANKRSQMQSIEYKSSSRLCVISMTTIKKNQQKQNKMVKSVDFRNKPTI